MTQSSVHSSAGTSPPEEELSSPPLDDEDEDEDEDEEEDDELVSSSVVVLVVLVVLVVVVVPVVLELDPLVVSPEVPASVAVESSPHATATSAAAMTTPKPDALTKPCKTTSVD